MLRWEMKAAGILFRAQRVFGESSRKYGISRKSEPLAKGISNSYRWRSVRTDSYATAAYSYAQPKQNVKKHLIQPQDTPEFLEWANEVTRNFNENGHISWDIVKEEAVSKFRHINDVSFGAVVLNICVNNTEAFGMAESIFRWIQKPNVTQLSLFLRICADHPEKTTESQILELYKIIQVKCNGIWGRHLSPDVIHGLCQTSKWKESLKIIKSMRESTGEGVNCDILTDVVLAAFRHNEYDMGWKLLDEWSNSTVSFTNALEGWLQMCPKTHENFERFVNFCNDMEVYPSQSLMVGITDFLHHLEYSQGVKTRISRKTFQCSQCGDFLQQDELTEEEFKTLQEHILSRLLVQDDIFVNTSPAELKYFKTFIDNEKPFDFVIDGLNVTHTFKNKTVAQEALHDLLIRISEHNKRLLFVARKHMGNRKSIMTIIRRYCHVMLVNDASRDDPFILYAALKSGSNSYCISRDFMRSQIYNLNDFTTRKLFKRWQRSRQIRFSTNFIKKQIYLRRYADASPVIQKDPVTGNWHVPYFHELVMSPYEIPDNWMCFKANKAKQ